MSLRKGSHAFPCHLNAFLILHSKSAPSQMLMNCALSSSSRDTDIQIQVPPSL